MLRLHEPTNIVRDRTAHHLPLICRDGIGIEALQTLPEGSRGGGRTIALRSRRPPRWETCHATRCSALQDALAALPLGQLITQPEKHANAADNQDEPSRGHFDYVEA